MLAAKVEGSERSQHPTPDGFVLFAAAPVAQATGALADAAALLHSAVARLASDLARSGHAERRIASELSSVLRRLSEELRMLSRQGGDVAAERRIEALRDVLKTAIESRGGAVTRDGGILSYPNAAAAERGELRRLEAELSRILAMLGALLARLRALGALG